MTEGHCEENAPDARAGAVAEAQPAVRWFAASDALACAAIAPDDAVLLRRVAAGDRDAFERIVLRHGDRIEAICRRFLPPTVVPDACQEVALQLWLSAGTYRGDGSVAGWIGTVAHNKAVEIALKESSRRRRIAGALGDHEEARLPDGRCEVTRVVERDLLTRAMASIDRPEDRYVFWLVYVEGRDIAEVAGHLYLSTETVKSRLKRAKRKLRWLHGDAALG